MTRLRRFCSAVARAIRGRRDAPAIDDRLLRFLPVWATQYYVAGRAAAMAGLMPIHGNLLHHAVEMYLKTALVGVVSLEDMKKKYGHNLKRLWRRYKRKETDPALNPFDSTIRALHSFENLRYPDTISEAAFVLSIAWTPSHSVTMSGAAAKRTRKYEVVISDVDRLVIEIMKRAQLNPKYFVTTVATSGRAALVFQNPHAADW